MKDITIYTRDPRVSDASQVCECPGVKRAPTSLPFPLAVLGALPGSEMSMCRLSSLMFTGVYIFLHVLGCRGN